MATLWWFPASSDPGTGKTAVVFHTRIILFHWHNKALQLSTHVITATASEQFYVQYNIKKLKLSMALEWSGLRRRSTAARLLRSWVRIPPGAWMFVCCECCVLSGRGLCDGTDHSFRGILPTVARRCV